PVIPLYTPECRQCPSCLSRKTNLCTAIRATQGQGVMPDGTSRFSLEGKKLHHYMGTSTFSNFTVLPEIAVAKIREDAPFDKVCYIGCGATTGIGAVINTAKVETGAGVAVFGLGGIGLTVVQGCRLLGAGMIGGGDLNPRRGPRPQRRAEDRRLVHGEEDQHRRSDHRHAEARRDQQGLRTDARRRVDPQRRRVLRPGKAVAATDYLLAIDQGTTSTRAILFD